MANQSANATLALGASPIMASAPEEMYDLSRILGALLINFGTVTDKEGMLAAGQFANDVKKPVVFDPVGVGATEFRRKIATELLNTWQASVIKGNAGELAALADSVEVGSKLVTRSQASNANGLFLEVQAKGVDSVGVGFANPATFVRDLAKKEREFVANLMSSVYACLQIFQDVLLLLLGLLIGFLTEPLLLNLQMGTDYSVTSPALDVWQALV